MYQTSVVSYLYGLSCRSRVSFYALMVEGTSAMGMCVCMVRRDSYDTRKRRPPSYHLRGY